MSKVSEEYDVYKALMLSEFANYAYEEPQVFSEFCEKNYPKFKQYFFEAKSTDTQVYVHVGPDEIIISFRGTESRKDVQEDLRIIDAIETENGSIHQGFLEAFESIWCEQHRIPTIIGDNGWILAKKKMTFPDFLKEQAIVVKNKGRYGHYNHFTSIKSIWITGHSLGGALAVLAMAEMPKNLRAYCNLFTFGAPPVGDTDYANYLESEFQGRMYRFVNDSDAIPRSLALCCYVQAGLEILYKSSGEGAIVNPTLCDSFLESMSGMLQGLLSFSFCSSSNTLCDPFSDHEMEHYVSAAQNCAKR